MSTHGRHIAADLKPLSNVNMHLLEICPYTEVSSLLSFQKKYIIDVERSFATILRGL